MHHLHCSVVILGILAAAANHEIAAQDHRPGLPPTRIGRSSDDFARLFPSRVKTFVKASYDPDDRPIALSQGNDDGFSGMNLTESYREVLQGSPVSVLAHWEGRPGVMGLFFRNFWSDFTGQPAYQGENNRTSFWLDGVLAHDMPLREYFGNEGSSVGQMPPFTGPFTGHRSGGYLTHTQLRWDNSFKLGLWDDGFHNASRFHRVAVTLGAPEGDVPEANMEDWTRIARQRGQWPHRTPRQEQVVNLSIAPGARQTVIIPGPATLLELTSVVSTPADYENLWARFYWDGEVEPSVHLPMRLLGGMMAPPYSAPIDGLMFHNDGDRQATCYMPMPFRTNARLEFLNTGTSTINMDLTTATQAGAYQEPWGYFTALYQFGRTGTGETFPGPRLVDARGMLRCLMLEDRTDNTGAISSMHMTHLEGDLCVRINGNRGDDHSFAATETSIGRWGWYLTPADQPFSQDSSFQTGLHLQSLQSGHFEARRLMGSLFVFDPIQFVDGIEIMLEHGVQNLSNADYGLAAFLYVEPGAARRTLAEIDIGDPSSEVRHQVQFTQWTRYTRSGAFFRDQFFGTAPVTDDIRHIRDYLRFRVVRPLETEQDRPVGIGFRLDRLGGPASSICQAEVLVNGVFAGLLHTFTHSGVFPWKEGGECEVELPLELTRGKAAFTVEVRPVSGTDPLRIARAWVYEYLR